MPNKENQDQFHLFKRNKSAHWRGRCQIKLHENRIFVQTTKE